MKVLTTDNKQINGQRISVSISKPLLELHALKFFKWKGATKAHKSIAGRVSKLGSADYDSFIIHLKKLGY